MKLTAHLSSLLVGCSVLFATWAAPASAGTAQASFAVSINLQTQVNPIQTNAGLCRSNSSIGAFGAALTVVCETGRYVDFSGDPSSLPWTTQRDNDAYRFVTLVSRAGESLGTIDSYSGVGTVTSWRVISLANRDYLEMMVHW